MISILDNIIKPLKPMCEILSYADAAQDPVDFPTTPSLAIPIALKRANIKLSELNDNDYFEINEAFSVAAVANKKLLKISDKNLNVYGGAVAMGHPLGCSGTRIIVTLINALKKNNGRYGIAGICNGGGILLLYNILKAYFNRKCIYNRWCQQFDYQKYCLINKLLH